jgi:nitroreductase
MTDVNAPERAVPKAGLDVLEAIWTTRAMRRLDPERPVPEADLRTLMEAAAKAPSGGNNQPVQWIVVRDAGTRRRLGEIYREIAWRTLPAGYGERAKTDEGVARMLKSALYLADHLGDAPVLLIPCAPSGLTRVEGAVYPAIQNLMLAARGLGLGTTLTSMHRENEAAVKDLLGIPDDIATFAIIPLGYPLGRWGEARRRPVEESTHWDRWGRDAGPHPGQP